MRGRWFVACVGWYGLYQAFHIVLNATYLLGSSEPPFPGPPGGWDRQALAFLDALALFDLLNAGLAVVGVVAYLQHRAWGRPATAVAVTISLYAAAVFTYATIASGAWRQATSGPYLVTWIPFGPVVLLAGALILRRNDAGSQHA